MQGTEQEAGASAGAGGRSLVRPPVRRARRRHPVGRRRLLAGRGEPHRPRLRAAPARHPAGRASALFLIVRSRWTTEAIDATVAWRPLVLMLGAIVAFALVFEVTGLVPAILGLGRHRQLRDGREPLDDGGGARRRSSPSSPGCCSSRACRCRCPSGRGERRRGRSGAEPDLRLRRRRDAAELAVLPDRRAARHAGRRAAGAGAGRHHRHAAARDVHAAAGGGAHHAGRPLLRGPVRRLHHGDPGQYPRRELLRRHHASTATRWRARAAPARRWRSRRSARSSPAAWRPPSLPCSRSRWCAVAGSFQSPDYFGLLVFGMVAAVVLAQGSVVRSVAMVVLGLFLGLDRHRHRLRPDALHVRHLGARRRRRLRAGGDGPVRHRRGDREPGARQRRAAGRSRRSAGCGRRARKPGRPGRRCCAAPASARCSACCRAAAR